MALTLHQVWSSGLPLCVLCRRCRRRALVPHAAIGAQRGDMRPISAIRLVCSRCGARDVVVRIARSEADIRRFLDQYRR